MNQAINGFMNKCLLSVKLIDSKLESVNFEASRK